MSLTDFSDLRAAVDDLNGLDLSTTQRDTLINEGHVKLATESGFLRANVPFTAVTDQETYELPSDVFRIIKVFVGGVPYAAQDEETVLLVADNQLYQRGDGIFYITYSAAGVESLGIKPAVDAGTSITAVCVLRPPIMDEDTDEPAVPPEFRRAIVDYVAAIALGSIEDAVELRAFHQQEFERARSELGALRNMKVGQGPRQLRVKGIHV